MVQLFPFIKLAHYMCKSMEDLTPVHILQSSIAPLVPFPHDVIPCGSQRHTLHYNIHKHHYQTKQGTLYIHVQYMYTKYMYIYLDIYICILIGRKD